MTIIHLSIIMSMSLLIKSTGFRSFSGPTWFKRGAAFAPSSPSFRQFRRSFHHMAAYPSVASGQNNTTETSSSRAANLRNADLVQRRLQVAREKSQSRRQSAQSRTLRHLHVKRLLQNTTNSSTAFTIPPLYQLKVTVCEDLRQDLLLSGREKRGRVFVEKESDAVHSLRSLRAELHGFFRALRKGTYMLSAGYPVIEGDGTVTAAQGDNRNAATTTPWPIRTDQDVVEMFQRADDYFSKHQSDTLKRPSLVLYVQRDPDAPPPPPLPHYLVDMPDPGSSPTMTMLSFYSFPPHGIVNAEEFALSLQKLWKPFQALGRVYVAPEGVNAQMSVPTNVLDRFRDCCLSVAELGDYMENGLNVDPVALSRQEFFDSPDQPPPFTNLHVRVRNKIVADGLEKSYEWQRAGYDMPPLEWHAKLKQARDLRNQGRDIDFPIVLDFRNTYETDVGRFEGAEPLGTINFRDSWDVVNKRLADTPKDTPIMMYCTGGIRCVKAGAYVTQELGFTNVARLAGGIIAYDRTLSEKAAEEESMFKGTNFVFDNRLARQITDDALGTCLTCGGDTALVSNCRNENCHKRMVQCEQCRTTMQGTCSEACNNRLINGQMRPLRIPQTYAETSSDSSEPVTYSSLDQYSMGHSTPPPSVCAEIELNTRAFIPSGSHMVSGASQGRLLTQLASMTREGRILELGTFTGYATTCLLEGAMNVGQLLGDERSGSRESGPYVLTMERDAVAYDVAIAHLKTVAEHGLGEFAAEKLCELRASGTSSIPSPDESLVTLDCGGVATCELVRVNDALAKVEEMAAGRGELLPGPFDIIFVDADKTRLLDYAEACLSSDRLLKKGGLLVVDNVLWKGLVLEASTGTFSSLRETNETDDSELRKNRRARKLAMKMHRFNSAIVQDCRAEVLVLPMRDGLSVIRKK